MASHPGAPYSDSPHMEDGQPASWFAPRTSIVIVGVIFFILTLAGTIVLGYLHLESETKAILTSDRTTASLLATFIEKHNYATLAILQSYANEPRFVSAIKNRDTGEASRHLSSLKSNSGIDLTFVTDPAGILWISFPHFPEAIGKDLSHREWYQGIRSQWKPFISPVFKMIVADQSLAVALCVPVFDADKGVIGILATSQRLEYLKETVENLLLPPDSQVSVLDQTGLMLYSNSYPYRQKLARHPHAEDILAMTAKCTIKPIRNEQPEGRNRRYLTVVPVDSSGWRVTIERSRKDIFLAQKRHLLEMGLYSLLIYMLVMFLFAYVEKSSQVKKTEKLLQAEQELRALSARHEAILSAVPEIIMEMDINKVYTWANPVGLDFFGEDVIGKEAAFYLEGEQDTYAKIEPLLQGSKERVYVESWQRRRDGEARLLAWWCKGLKDEHGKVIGGLSSAYDITEQKRAEDKFKQIFETTVTGISITLPSGEVDVNPAFASMLGYEVAELKATKWQDISHPDDLASTREAIQPLLDGTASSSRFVKRYLHKDGSTVWADLGTTLRRDHLGKPLYFVTTINDITERKLAEERVSVFTEELTRSNAELQQFAYVASHDLQEPLRMISSYLQLLERRYKDRLDDDANTFIGYAVDGAVRMQALIKGLLDFSRIKTHGQEFALVHVTAVVDGVCRNLQAMITEADAAVHYGKLPIIMGDEVQIARVFQNLLQNGLKFRKQDTPLVINIGVLKSDDGWIFSVSDNGIGIEEQYFQRIFTIFQRLHTREEYPGTGIGLSVCKRIVERHGGRIWLESTPGVGTTFYFTIPEGKR